MNGHTIGNYRTDLRKTYLSNGTVDSTNPNKTILAWPTEKSFTVLNDFNIFIDHQQRIGRSQSSCKKVLISINNPKNNLR